MEFIIKKDDNKANITIENRVQNNNILIFDVKMLSETKQIPKQFKILFKISAKDIYSVWSPELRYNRSLGASWSKMKTNSRLTSWMPIHSFVSLNGKNKATIALSDAKTPISISSGICEYDACIDCEIAFFTAQVAP